MILSSLSMTGMLRKQAEDVMSPYRARHTSTNLSSKQVRAYWFVLVIDCYKLKLKKDRRFGNRLRILPKFLVRVSPRTTTASFHPRLTNLKLALKNKLQILLLRENLLKNCFIIPKMMKNHPETKNLPIFKNLASVNFFNLTNPRNPKSFRTFRNFYVGRSPRCRKRGAHHLTIMASLTKMTPFTFFPS